MAGGRPSAYKAEFATQAEKLCKLGATDIELADFFGVERTTIWRWSQVHEEFCNALKAGKLAADERVERSLYARATGYTFDAVKIFNANGEPLTVPYREHVPPDTTAAIFWLKNRRPDAWRDKTERDVNVKHTFVEFLKTLDERTGMATPEGAVAPVSGEPTKICH